jgi:hypothetical protein
MIEATDTIGTLRRCSICYHKGPQCTFRTGKQSHSKVTSTVTTSVPNAVICYRTQHGKCLHKSKQCNSLVNKVILPVFTPGALRHCKVCNPNSDFTPIPIVTDQQSQPSSSTSQTTLTYV